MLLQSYFLFPVLNRKTIFSKTYSYFLSLLFAFTYIFVFNDSKITKDNLFEEMNTKWDCIFSKNTCFQQIFMGTEKKSKKVFLLYENMEDKRKNQISIYTKILNILPCKESKF